MPHENATCLIVDGFWCINAKERAEQNPRSPEVMGRAQPKEPRVLFSSNMAGMESAGEVRNLRKQKFGRGGTGGWR